MRILIIEDELRVANAIKRSLETKDYIINIESNSNRGLLKALNQPYDLLILDLMLPGSYTGKDITKILRSKGVNMPILMLTALGDVEDRIAGLRLGADDYLVKPFSMRELIARTQVLLRRPQYLISSILKVGNLELNSDTFEVKRKKINIQLSGREYKMLRYLMYHHDQIISKEQIINHVWDEDTLIMPNTVEVYIGYLRKKIDKNFPNEPKLIHTAFGFGYMIGLVNSDV